MTDELNPVGLVKTAKTNITPVPSLPSADKDTWAAVVKIYR